ncbi:hypothetical protein AAFF_G00173170 [Aldrovandia affinis]|uniref:Uncharacterized protein n=1 Tax=Aldrovandia affinis TaxID=143900 RepID=A0AAD7WVP5_9TELE|nr:hypothetical protein AAFF_G00173170 [Aldrovandia affinis]
MKSSRVRGVENEAWRYKTDPFGLRRRCAPRGSSSVDGRTDTDGWLQIMKRGLSRAKVRVSGDPSRDRNPSIPRHSQRQSPASWMDNYYGGLSV